MEDKDTNLFYLGAGPMAAVLLGAALVPLRGFTTASNYTFAFLALTIVVAEFGGRWAAVATALTSALSLDFFLLWGDGAPAGAESRRALTAVAQAVAALLAGADPGRLRLPPGDPPE